MTVTTPETFGSRTSVRSVISDTCSDSERISASRRLMTKVASASVSGVAGAGTEAAGGTLVIGGVIEPSGAACSSIRGSSCSVATSGTGGAGTILSSGAGGADCCAVAGLPAAYTTIRMAAESSWERGLTIMPIIVREMT